MGNYVPLIIDGLADAALIFFVAVGLTLVFSVLRILNVAHGSFYALGAYISVAIGTWLTARCASGEAAGMPSLLRNG